MLMLKEFVRNTSNDGCLVAKLQRRTYNYISKPVISSKKSLDVDFVTTVEPDNWLQNQYLRPIKSLPPNFRMKLLKCVILFNIQYLFLQK